MEPARLLKQFIRDTADQEWVAATTEAIEEQGFDEVYESAVDRNPVIQRLLHGAAVGHPLHPLLSDVPTGAWTTAFVLDMADVLFKRPEMRPAADLAIALGLIGGTATAITGWADWKYTSGRTKRIGLIHGLLNVASANCYLVSFVLRRVGARGAGQIASIAGFGLLIAGAHLGGELVFDRLVGTTRASEPDFPEDYTAVISIDDLPDRQPTQVEVDGETIVLVRAGQDVYALKDSCAHLGVSLSGGEVHDGCIACPAHGSTFELDTGTVVDGPSAYPQPVFDVRIRDGQVEVRASR